MTRYVNLLLLGVVLLLGVTGTSAATPAWTPLMAPADVSAHVQDGTVVVLDLRAPKAKTPAESYLAGHIPGALNAPYPSWRGPKANPGQLITPEALTARLRSLGLTTTSAVVIAHQGRDASDFGAAARVYWTLKSSGLTKLAILDGGVTAWRAAGLGLDTEVSTPEPSSIEVSFNDAWLANRDDVQAIIDGEAGTLVDARPDPFLTGKRKHPAAKAAGTLPGSTQIDNLKLIGGKASLGDDVPILTRLRQTGAIPDTGPVVSFCNTGHWAATNWFVMSELEGRADVKLYAGSMVDWTLGGGQVETRKK